jgi:hypothetical protein
MCRFALYAVLLFQSTVAVCQFTATQPGSSQVPGKGSTVQWPFDFSKSQSGQTAAKPSFKSLDCPGSKTAQNQATAPIDFDHLFNTSCTDLKSHVEFFARNENPLSRSPLVVQPHSKGEPIPTQWPNAKFEQIPTQWPNLKRQPIDGGSSGLVPAHGSAK